MCFNLLIFEGTGIYLDKKRFLVEGKNDRFIGDALI